MKIYSTLYDDTKGFVGSGRPSSFNDVEKMMIGVLRAKETIEDLIERNLRCAYASRYGWREEYTLKNFKGNAERLLATALCLTHTLASSTKVTKIDINVEGCAAGR